MGLAPDLPNISGLLTVNWSGIGLQACRKPTYANPGYRTHTEELQDHLSWFMGRHNLKFGFDMLRPSTTTSARTANLFGNVTFSSKFTSGGIRTRNPYADFLLGIPTRLRALSASPRGPKPLVVRLLRAG